MFVPPGRKADASTQEQRPSSALERMGKSEQSSPSSDLVSSALIALRPRTRGAQRRTSITDRL
jgi:hypothetical protein